jgi:hypothetical protein
MRTIKPNLKGAPFYNAFLRTWLKFLKHLKGYYLSAANTVPAELPTVTATKN